MALYPGIYANCEAFFNCTRTLQSDKLHYLTEGRNIVAKKKIIKRFLKLKKKIMYPNQCGKSFLTSTVPMSTINSMNTYYPYEPEYIPVAMNGWNGFQSPLLAVQPATLILPSPSPVFASQMIPIPGIIQPILTPVVTLPQTFIQDELTSMADNLNEYNFSEPIDDPIATNEHTHYIQDEIITKMIDEQNNNIENTNIESGEDIVDPIEAYLVLPRTLFPTARMMTLDPNPIIDEFCKLPNLQRHMPWILDLEFGIPKSPITRPIPIYNVKFNSIHCKNTPDAIHPGFESCGPDFKRALLFYYDCIVSAWYRGYVIMKCDQSVDNFQSWLLLPMQVLGICWP